MEGVPSAAESMEGVPEAMLAVAAPGPPTLLKIFLVRARGLPIMDKHIFSKGGSSDPMVLLRVGSEERKSTCKKKTLEPLWGEAFEVGVDDAVDSLVLEVRDVDLARTEFMGRVAIPLEPLAGGEPQRAWYALLDKNGQAGGEVECVLRWIHDAAFAYALPAAFSAPVVRGPPNLLCVLLVRARGLAVMDKNVLSAGGSSDPVATFAVRGSGGASVRSSVRKKTLSPDWMEDFDLEAEEDGSRLLEFTLEDADVGRREFMGQFQIDLDAGRGGEVKRAWHALLDKDGGPAMGRVDLALRWVHDPSRVIQLPFSQREAHPLKAPNLLRVFLIRARGLAVMDRNLLSKGGSSDPVVSFEMRGHGGKRQTSKVKKKCLAPKWLESFEVDCDEADGFVDFTVEDYDRARGNDFMGTFSVDVHDLVSRQTCRRWHNLCNADGTAAQGDVEVALRWEHEAHPDLPANTLRIYLVRARGLAAMDTSLFSKKGTSDPFVTFEHRGDVQKSKVKPKTLAPTWLESFEFAFEDGAVTLTVEDYDVASSADFMG
ncbi:C2 domain-containing protein, partial [Pelagophyceae sp. CCMP2097]